MSKKIFFSNSAPLPRVAALLMFSVNSVIRSMCESCMLMLNIDLLFSQILQSSLAFTRSF